MGGYHCTPHFGTNLHDYCCPRENGPSQAPRRVQPAAIDGPKKPVRPLNLAAKPAKALDLALQGNAYYEAVDWNDRDWHGCYREENYVCPSTHLDWCCEADHWCVHNPHRYHCVPHFGTNLRDYCCPRENGPYQATKRVQLAAIDGPKKSVPAVQTFGMVGLFVPAFVGGAVGAVLTAAVVLRLRARPVQSYALLE